MLRYFGVLNGSSLSPSGIHDESAVIPLESLQHARHVLYMADGGWRDTLRTNLHGEYQGDIPAGIGEGARLTVWAAPRSSAHVFEGATPHDVWGIMLNVCGSDIIPDREYVVGPRGGISERLW